VSTASVVLEPRGPFSLAHAARFLEGFAPAAHAAAPDPGHLHLAFVPDGTRAAGGACVRHDGETLVLEAFGAADPDAVRNQVERILSLDVDASGFAAVGARDPVVGGLQARYPGLRPVNFLSPFEAGAWFLLGHRVRMAQAARMKAQLRDALGERVDVHGDERVAFPAPERIAGLEHFAGVPDVKLERLRALAGAALDGRLDGARLRAMPSERAAEELLELPGVGPFTADGIVLRGAGAPDHLTLAEPRLGQAVALAYGLDDPPDATRLRALSDGWRPFRAWVTVLLRIRLEDERREAAAA
jgi:DNA-3-methyladenine glycosylase II